MDVARQVILSHDAHSEEYFLVYGVVPYEVICLLVCLGQIVDFAESQFFIFSQSIAMFDLKVLVVVVMNEVFADVAERNDVLNLVL